MTRLGYFVPDFPSQTHAFFWREASALREAGAEVAFFSSRRPPDDACPHEFAEEARRETRYVYPPDLLRALRVIGGRPRRFLQCLRYASRLSESTPTGRATVLALIPSAADLVWRCRLEKIGHVHFHSCANSAHLGALAKLLGDISYSVTVHGDLPVYGTDHAQKFAAASVVTAVTRPLAEQVSAVRPQGPAPVISMGVDVAAFAPDVSRDIGETGAGTLFVTVSRLHRAKGHRHFLEAMRRLLDEGMDLRYVIAGAGPDKAQIEEQIRALDLGDRVSLPGTLGQQEIRELLQRADAFVLTSEGLGEAAPVAVMEAMACGTPAICSRIGGTADMIEDGVDGFLVPQRDVARITEAARRIASDPPLRRRMGQAAREKAVAAFDYRVKARELLRALRDVSAG